MSDFDAINEPVSRRVSHGLAKIGLAFRSQSWQYATDRGLTPTQGQILALILARGPLRPTAIADELGIRQPTASDAVAALVRKGYVDKRPTAEDRRATTLWLTPEGQAEAKRSRANTGFRPCLTTSPSSAW